MFYLLGDAEMKLIIKEIKKVEFSNADVFSGAFQSRGVLVEAVVTDCPDRAWLEVGFNDLTVIDGKEISLFFKDDAQDTLAALWRVQQQVATDLPLVTKVVSSKFIAEDTHGRDVVCDTMEEALDVHKRFGNPRQIDDIKFIGGE